MGFAGAADSAAIEAQGPYASLHQPDSMWGLLTRTASKFGSRKAVTFQMFAAPGSPDETLTWAEYRAQVAQLANLLRSLGVGPTDAVAYLMPNCTETVVAYAAGQVAGIVNPINPLLDAGQIAGILRESKAKVLITLRAFPKTEVAQKAAEAVALAPNVTTVIEVDLLRYLTGVKRLIVPLIRPKVAAKHQAKVLDYHREVAKQPRDLTWADDGKDRVSAYFHTGGTTGMPKLAQHRSRGVAYNAWLGATLLFRETDVIMCPLPMFHVFAAIVAMGASLGSGAQIVFPTPQGYRGEGVFDNFWTLIERYRATFLITVPTAISALMQRPVNADLSSLRLAFSGSAPLPIELYNRFEAAAGGLKIMEGYGLTEATCLVSINPPDGERKVGSVGLPFPYNDVRIIDPGTQMEVERDHVGEICVKGPGVWGGNTYTEADKNRDLYYPDETGAPAYLRTGDLGRIDADGYIWITGRAKDIIIRGGHNIDPADIEEALVRHPAVAMAGAIGQPDAHAGEVPAAYVELVKGASATPEELMAFAKANIGERAAHPKHIEILPELPKTAVGKIFKPDLRRLAIQRIYDEALAAGGLSARVVEVIEDRKRGLVARISRGDEEAAVTKVLGAHTRPWEWAA